MKLLKAHISIILTVVMLAGCLLPALHAFDHEIVSSENQSDLSQKFSKASLDCQLCDFHIADTNAPTFFTYEVFSPLKETVYSISLAETINLFPDPLFSLRAPPAMIS